MCYIVRVCLGISACRASTNSVMCRCMKNTSLEGHKVFIIISCPLIQRALKVHSVTGCKHSGLVRTAWLCAQIWRRIVQLSRTGGMKCLAFAMPAEQATKL